MLPSLFPVGLRPPPASEAAAHRPVREVELPAQIGAVRKQGGYCGAGIAVMPRKRVVDFVGGAWSFLKRTHVVVLLCPVPQQASFLGYGWAAASPACSQYVLVVWRVNRHVKIIPMGPL